MIKRLLYTLLICTLAASCSRQNGPLVLPTNEDELAGHSISAVSGSYYAQKLSTRKDIDLAVYASDSDALQALLSGKTDLMANDEVVLNHTLRQEYGLVIAFKGEDSFPTAVVFNKDAKWLADTMSELQAEMEQDGSMDSLRTYWLEEKYLEDGSLSHIAVENSEDPFRVACATNMAPISFLVNSDWFGLEVDLVRLLSKKLHRKIEFKRYDPAAAMMALKTHKADVMIGGAFVTPEREEEFCFAKPYHSFSPAYFAVDKGALADKGSIWKRLTDKLEKNLIREAKWKYIVSGLWMTIKITILAILLGSILGIGLCAMAKSRRKWLRSTAGVYSWFMAGIPMLVLLLILFYVVFGNSGINSTAVAVIAFALNFASGASGIYSNSLDAIPRGQTEAGLALGFTRLQTFVKIVLPQAIKRGLPLYRSQCIALLKGTSIVGYIAIQDLTRAGDIIRSRTFDALIPLMVVTIVYFLLAWLLGRLVSLANPKSKVL